MRGVSDVVRLRVPREVRRLSRAQALLVAVVAAALMIGLATAPADLDGSADPVVTRHGDRPNVVLIVTDDQRRESLRGMRHVQQLLVARGARFSHAMVPTALCCPSRASILTGLYSHTTRLYGNGDVGGRTFGGWAQFHRRGMEFRTLATALDGAGYRTGFYGKYLNDFSKLSPDGYRPPGWDEFAAFKFSRGAYFGYQLTDGSYHGYEPDDYSTDVLADKAARFVRRTPQDQPVFVMWAPYGPHSPFTPAPRHGATEVAPPVPLPRAAVQDPQRTRNPAQPRWQARRARHHGASAAEVAEGQTRALLSVDEGVASLVQAMEATGRAEDTLFVFMSDNGYLWGEHGMVGKDMPYAAATRIPVVLRWDGRIPAGTVDRRLALNLDVATTIARAARAPMVTEGLDLLGERKRRGFVLEAMAGYRRRPPYCGWRTKRWMFLRWATGRTELYDYRHDPAERRDLAGKRSARDVERRLEARAVRACRPEPPGFDW